jgi:hypothetical protein
VAFVIIAAGALFTYFKRRQRKRNAALAVAPKAGSVSDCAPELALPVAHEVESSPTEMEAGTAYAELPADLSSVPSVEGRVEMRL